MAKCELCGKGPTFGNNVSFSKRHTRRMWRPNIQKTSLVLDGGIKVQVKICTRCQRTLQKSR